MILCVRVCAEVANKEKERQEVECNIQSNASPSHSLPDGHAHDQSQSLDASPPDDIHDDTSAEHVAADHVTWNGEN